MVAEVPFGGMPEAQLLQMAEPFSGVLEVGDGSGDTTAA
jgi:hypothetical protein